MGTVRTHSRTPRWWSALFISLALVAIVFDKVGNSSPPSILHGRTTQGAYSDKYRQQPSPEWSLEPVHAGAKGSVSPSPIPTSSDTADTSRSTSSTAKTVSYTFPGYLIYPDNIISSIPIPASGSIVADAAWSPDAPLELILSCGPADQMATGSYQASVTMNTVESACTVALQEHGSVAGPIDYTLSVAVTSS